MIRTFKCTSDAGEFSWSVFTVHAISFEAALAEAKKICAETNVLFVELFEV